MEELGLKKYSQLLISKNVSSSDEGWYSFDRQLWYQTPREKMSIYIHTYGNVVTFLEVCSRICLIRPRHITIFTST